jgi:large conductance mechanosensitive channel
MWKEFKEFAMKGKIMDLAVGVVIGGAFQGIVKSLVDDIIMPVITIFTGKMDFSELTFTLGNSSIKYGSFITAVVNFLIIAFSIFLFVRYMNKLNKKLETITEEEIKKSVNYQWAKIILNIFEKVGLNG